MTLLKLDNYKSKNLKIGLLGGSFDPPHEGHIHISRDALKRFELDYVWWIVTKQNSLKERKATDSNKRIQLCEELTVNVPSILVSDVERDIESYNTIDLIKFLQEHCPNEYFWIMGSDSFLSFDKWPGWEEMLSKVKLIVYERHGYNKLEINPLLRQCSKKRAEFLTSALPAWTLVKTKKVKVSSTEIREGRK